MCVSILVLMEDVKEPAYAVTHTALCCEVSILVLMEDVKEPNCYFVHVFYLLLFQSLF